MHPLTNDILNFWFGTTDLIAPIEKREIWFKSTPEFDAALVERFSHAHEQAAAGDLDHLRDNAVDCVALVISLDQFPRNIYRGTGKAFESDPKAREISHHALAQGFDDALTLEARKFFYLPLVHSEDIADHNISVEKYQAFDDPKSLTSAIGHREAIARFGRFPHRNKVLGRTNTPEEEEYLKIPPTWGMTAAEAAARDAMVAKLEAEAKG